MNINIFNRHGATASHYLNKLVHGNHREQCYKYSKGHIVINFESTRKSLSTTLSIFNLLYMNSGFLGANYITYCCSPSFVVIAHQVFFLGKPRIFYVSLASGRKMSFDPVFNLDIIKKKIVYFVLIYSCAAEKVHQKSAHDLMFSQ